MTQYANGRIPSAGRAQWIGSACRGRAPLSSAACPCQARTEPQAGRRRRTASALSHECQLRRHGDVTRVTRTVSDSPSRNLLSHGVEPCQ
jgi:hypothetical protein